MHAYITKSPKILILLAILTSLDAYAVNFSINPYAGGGSLSDGSTVRSATGIRGTLEKLFPLNSRLVMGPRIELGNTYINARNEREGRRVLSTYDNRFLVGGLHTGFLFALDNKFPHEAYSSLCAGRAIAKLNQDESGKDYYAQRQYTDIKGYYYTGEIGTNFQVRRDIAFNFALIGNYFDAEMGKSRGTLSGEYANKDGVFKLNGDEEDEVSVPDRVIQRVVTLSFGLNISI